MRTRIRRTATALMATAAIAGLGVLAAAPASADTVSPAFATQAECLTVQNEYNRYYEIVEPCQWGDPLLAWFFIYR